MKEKKAKIGKKILKGSQKSENHNFESYVEEQLQQNYGTEVSPALWIYQNTDPHSQCFPVSCPARCFQPPTISSILVCNSKIIFYVCYNVKKSFKAPIEYTTVVTMSALRYILSKKNLKNNRCNCISYAVVVVQSLCAGALSRVHSVVSTQSCPALCNHGLLDRLLCSMDSPGKNAGVDCISFSRALSRPRDQTWVSCIGKRILYH